MAEMTCWLDCKHRRMLAVKILFFLSGTTVGCLLMFSTLFLKEAGLTGSEIGILTTISSCLSLFVVPLLGILGDHVNRHALVFALFSAIRTALWIPLPFLPTLLPTSLDANYSSYSCAGTSISNETFQIQVPSGLLIPKTRTNFSVEYCDNADLSQMCSFYDNATTCINFENINLLQRSNESDFIPLVNISQFLCEGAKGISASTLDCSWLDNSIEEQITGSARIVRLVFLAILLVGGDITTIFATNIGSTIGVQMSEKYGTGYGFQVAWMSYGSAIGSVVAGVLVDAVGERHFEVAFYTAAVFSAMAAMFSLFQNFTIPRPEKSSKRRETNVKSFMTNPHVLSLLMLTIVDASVGRAETFLAPIFAVYLGASSTFIGIVVLLMYVFGGAASVGLTKLTKFFGHPVLLFLLILVKVAGLVVQTVMDSYYYYIAISALRGSQTILMSSASSEYIHLMFGNRYASTAQSILGTLRNSGGSVIGGVLGGFLLDAYGMRKTFAILVGISTTLAAVYLICYFAVLRTPPKNLVLYESQKEQGSENGNAHREVIQEIESCL